MVTGGHIQLTMADGSIRRYELDAMQAVAAAEGLRSYVKYKDSDKPKRLWNPDRARDLTAWKMRRMGYSYSTIGDMMGVSEWSAQSMVNRVEGKRYGDPFAM